VHRVPRAILVNLGQTRLIVQVKRSLCVATVRYQRTIGKVDFCWQPGTIVAANRTRRLVSRAEAQLRQTLHFAAWSASLLGWRLVGAQAQAGGGCSVVTSRPSSCGGRPTSHPLNAIKVLHIVLTTLVLLLLYPTLSLSIVLWISLCFESIPISIPSSSPSILTQPPRTYRNDEGLPSLIIGPAAAGSGDASPRRLDSQQCCPHPFIVKCG
jgi:hypothetical protein